MSTTSWPLKRVGLRVRDLERVLAYYQQLGLSIMREEEGGKRLGLGVGGLELLTLHHTPEAPARKPHTAGLYHFAILLPSEADLGTFLRNSLEGPGVSIDGASDHLVSQALYLNDPEGNGIEVYADRPRSQWEVEADGSVKMGILRLRARELMALGSDFHGLPEGTILGHMHLNVSDLAASTAWYEQTLGLELKAQMENSAAFVSWDGYHHHLGLNTWTGPHAAPHQPDVSGIEFFEFSRPGLPVGTHTDPNGVTVLVS